MLEKARPLGIRQPRSPILIGLGLGFLGSYLLGNYFDSNNEDKIDELNDNIHKKKTDPCHKPTYWHNSQKCI